LFFVSEVAAVANPTLQQTAAAILVSESSLSLSAAAAAELSVRHTNAMVPDRKMMIDALKLTVVPLLRERGFKGSFPHFRRIGESKTDLLTFQFDKWGGGFIIELGEGPPDELVEPWGRVTAAKLTTHLLPLSKRVRLNAAARSAVEKWFRFANDQASMNTAADEVVKLLPQADKWWQGDKTQANIRAFT
jgi:hypothetical protein